MSTPTLRHQLLAILLHELESAGYPLGTAKYLQVQELLRQAPADLPLEQWRGLLAPLFAGSPQEQEQFYALFDKSLELTRSLQRTEPDTRTETPPVPPEIIQKETRWRRIVILLIALILLGIAGIWWFGQSNQPEKTDAPKASARSIRFSIPPGGDTSMLLRPAADTTPLLPGSARDWQATRLGGQYQVDSLGRASYRAATNASVGAIDSMLVILETAQKRDSIYWIADLIAQPEKPTPEKTDSLIAELSLPFPENADAFAKLRIDEQAQKTYAWYQRWQWPIKAALLILLGFLAWAIARWDQYRRAKAVAELQRPDRAPYLWNPETGTDASAYLSADAQALLTRLRGRSLDERLRLDLPATVLASIRAAGRIQLRYRRQTLPPDFLLLIDRHDAQDHRARLFDALYQVFLRAEVPITRYFYDGDPRLCFNEANPGGIALSELLHRHAGAQLLLVGDGQGLLSTLSGRVAPWTNLLQAWPRRALLQTRPLGQWARREKELQALLPLLPASPAGLGAAIDLFNSEDPTTLNPEVLKGIPDALQQPFAFAHELLPDLQRHFAQPYIDWIAACALWPTLHWDLTLYLGKVLADRGTGDMGQNDTGAGQARPLLDFAGIRELTRLPWFVEGRMPDAVRSILLEYLQARGLEQPLRLALRTLLEQAPPPPAEATAYDEYRMNLILNELFLQPDAAKKRALEREFARYLAAGKKPDFVALKLLNRPQTPLDVLVGDRLKKYAFREGLPGLGWQLLPKLLGIWAVLGLGLAWVQPFANPCAGEKVQYQQQTYCLQDKQDRLLYLEQLAADAIELQQHEKVDSIVNQVKNLTLDARAFHVNTATRYYNFGAKLYNCILQKDRNCKYPSEINLDSTFISGKSIYHDVLCTNFSKGSILFKFANKKVGLKYYQAMLRTCKTVDTSSRVPIPAMVRIPAGSFEMGDVMGDNEYPEEKPVHKVSVSAFELGRYEVTFAEYDLFCEATQREKPDDRGWGRGSRPVIYVSWEDVVAYCNWLSTQHGYQPVYTIKGKEVTANWTANGYRLPTEAEWEYAARGGGKKVRFGNGKDIADPKEINFDGSKENKKPYSQVGEYRRETVPVDSLNSPNALGLHDMSGNVYEWCWDWYDASYYAKSLTTNPRGPGSGSDRVFRGGSWLNYPQYVRAAFRYNFTPVYRGLYIGCRLARTP